MAFAAYVLENAILLFSPGVAFARFFKAPPWGFCMNRPVSRGLGELSPLEISKDLNRYLVDKFHLPATKSKNAPFETIDLSIYRPSAKCLAFSTSEDRLLLWITAFQYRYHELTGNAAEYKVTWEEQDSPSSASKCDKIIIHLIRLTSTGEEQLVTITVYLTTGRIQVQGKNLKSGAHLNFPYS